MRTIVALTAFFAFISAEVTLKNGRRYVPEEEEVFQERFIYMSDDYGVTYLVDLEQEQEQKLDVQVDVSDLTLYLYTRDNPAGEAINLDSLDDLRNSQYFDPSQKNLFTVHGWRGSHTSGVNTETRRAVYDIGQNVNVFAVNWNTPASEFYTFAVLSIPLVGEIIGNYINQMVEEYNFDASDFIFVGHSLGAHVAGCMGASVNGAVNQIVGLDPAWPMFTLDNRDNRLDESDATTVHIAHTNGGFQGFMSSIGHADYFFNGGSKQPGCGADISNSCAHGRALDYYIESILTSGFRSVQCTSSEEFQNGDCNGNPEVYFGGYPLDDNIFGDYYLDTAESSPFALE